MQDCKSIRLEQLNLKDTNIQIVRNILNIVVTESNAHDSSEKGNHDW